MRVDITGCDLQSLLELLKRFPQGRVEAKDNVAYWDFDMKGREIQVSENYQKQNVPEINKAARSVGSAQNWVQGAQEQLFKAFS
jgi:hypothetical protein